MNTLTNRDLKSTIEALRNTEHIIPSPFSVPENQVSIPEVTGINRNLFIDHGQGNNILLVIPTANTHKAHILSEAFERQKPIDRSVVIHCVMVPAESDVGEQPCNVEAGLLGARNRIQNALQKLVSNPREFDIDDVLAEKRIGTVMAASIENFIHGPGTESDAPIDYGVVMVHNAMTGRSAVGISRGVTVPRAACDYARSLGMAEDGMGWRVTVGEVLAANVEGLDRADWHAIVAGVSRYQLLREAVEKVEIPW